MYNITLHYYLLIAVLTAIAMHGQACASSTASPYQRIDVLLKDNNFQGTVLIASKNTIIFHQAYGFADLQHSIPNTTQTIYRLGSITKTFTAVSILQLQEQGLLCVHDPISKYIPDYPNGSRITVHHLLNHTSGIASITDLSDLEHIQKTGTQPLDTMKYVQGIPLQFNPGTECKYSDSGYILLGAVIEAVAKMPYESFIQNKIIGPLRLTSTHFERQNKIIPHKATGYKVSSQGDLEHAGYIDMAFPHAAGSLVSSAADLHTFFSALINHTLISPSSVSSMTKIQASSQEHGIAYGYGLMIGAQNQGLEEILFPVLGHSGTIDGFRSAAFFYPEQDLMIIILSNVENAPVYTLQENILNILLSNWRLNHAA